MTHCSQELLDVQGTGCENGCWTNDSTSRPSVLVSCLRLITQQHRSEFTKPVEVGLGLCVQCFRQFIEISQTVFHDGNPWVVETLGTIEKIDHTTANDRVDRHQLSLMWARKMRPPLGTMLFPRCCNHAPIHEVLLSLSAM